MNNKFNKRKEDWRNGAVIYQIFVDRFARPNVIDKTLYKAPKKLIEWQELPKRGIFLDDVKYYSHELDFYGGNLVELSKKIDHLKSLNLDAIYLNPIFESLSNHKYDATNYEVISAEYGNMEDLKHLIDIAHANNLKLILDGVFNHVGVRSVYYQAAIKHDPKYRNWFDFDSKYLDGVRLWADAKSLPELMIENKAVKDYIYQADDSIVKRYLKLGIDGWRLDVAFDLGYKYLKELTTSAHEVNDKSLIVGEIWNYPQKWLNSIDGIINFTFRDIILKSIQGHILPNIAMKMLETTINDTEYESILKSWIVLENHDSKRLTHILENEKDQVLAKILQITLPGSPNIYYGAEINLGGGDDPLNRAPFNWDLANESNDAFNWFKELMLMRKENIALKIGDFIPIISNTLFAYIRRTDKVEETIVVIINLGLQKVVENILLRDSDLMNYSKFETILGQVEINFFSAGIMEVTMEPKSFVIMKPAVKAELSYSPYKRIL